MHPHASLTTPAAVPSKGKLFPLLLTPFESFNLVDDRTDYPKTFVFDLHFLGVLDRNSFESAVDDALQRNPLLAAHVATDARGRSVWVAGTTRPTIRWTTPDQPLFKGYGKHVDLRSHVGLGVWICLRKSTTRLVLQFHHACCDGVGALHFLEDLLIAYGQAFTPGDGVPEPRKVDLYRLRRRHDLNLPSMNLWEKIRNVLIGLWHGGSFYLKSPTPLAKSNTTTNVSPISSDHVGFLTYRCPEALLHKLRYLAGDTGVSLNDLLLRSLFVTIRDWNAQHGVKQKHQKIRILMPTNLRTRADRTMPATNIMSFSFLTRRGAQCSSSRQLLSSIGREVGQIRRHHISLYFLGQLAAIDTIKKGLALLVRGHRCFATAVLTNLGDPTRRFTVRFPHRKGRLSIGNLVLENFSGVPPLRPKTHLALGVLTYAKQLNICLRCDPHYFSLEDTENLLGRYVSQLENNCSFQGGDARKPVMDHPES